MLGDDWAPEGYELWRNDARAWELHPETDPAWPWTDGLRHLVECIETGAEPVTRPEHAFHALEIMLAAQAAGADGRAREIRSDVPGAGARAAGRGRRAASACTTRGARREPRRAAGAAGAPRRGPTFDGPALIRRADVTRHIWGEPEAGEVFDWIYASTERVHMLVFGLPPGGGFRHSEEFRTVFAADEVLHVLEGVLVIADPETGEVQRAGGRRERVLPPRHLAPRVRARARAAARARALRAAAGGGRVERVRARAAVPRGRRATPTTRCSAPGRPRRRAAAAARAARRPTCSTGATSACCAACWSAPSTSPSRRSRSGRARWPRRTRTAATRC